MAIPHAKSGEIIDVRPLGERLKEKITATLVKTESLEVLRLVMPAGDNDRPPPSPRHDHRAMFGGSGEL